MLNFKKQTFVFRIAFVHFRNIEDATKAMNEHNGQKYYNTEMRIRYAYPREKSVTPAVPLPSRKLMLLDMPSKITNSFLEELFPKAVHTHVSTFKESKKGRG